MHFYELTPIQLKAFLKLHRERLLIKFSQDFIDVTLMEEHIALQRFIDKAKDPAAVYHTLKSKESLSFEASWGDVDSLVPGLMKVGCGVAASFSTTANVETDFSTINGIFGLWRLSLGNPLLDSIFPSKQMKEILAIFVEAGIKINIQ